MGGSLSGLAAGVSVVLQNNAGDNLTLIANGAFTFAARVAVASPYAVSVLTQPAGQTCTVAQGAGTVGNAAVANVAVSCQTNAPSTFTIGGSLTGLGSGSNVVLQNRGGSNLTLNTNGSFTFANAATTGTPYAVTVLTQPAGGHLRRDQRQRLGGRCQRDQPCRGLHAQPGVFSGRQRQQLGQ